MLSTVASPAESQFLQLAARSAEDAGDFVGALRLVRQLPDASWSRDWQHELEAAARLDPRDRAGLACWLIHPALRWAREQPRGAVLDEYADLMLRMLGVRVRERARRLAEVAARDPVVVDAALFDAGLFDGYLGALGPDALGLELTSVAWWSSQPVSVWEVLSVRVHDVELRNLSNERIERARRWPEAATGSLIYGRIVFVAGAIPRAFALAPVPVDQRCAARIVRARKQGGGPQERLRAIGRSRRRALDAESLPESGS